jgi:hypothetical protein
MDLYVALLLALVIGVVGSIAFGVAVGIVERRARMDSRSRGDVPAEARAPESWPDRSAA